jgi:3-phosphoshikimate 1-carboxyvinyltransferase
MNSGNQQSLNNSTWYEIKPGIMKGILAAPPSKSVSHRLLILAALSQKPSIIQNVLLSEDIYITLNALKQMGFHWKKRSNDIIFSGEREQTLGSATINVGNSGTSARLLTAIAAALPGEFIFTGSKRMLERPMMPLIDALIKLGVKIEHRDGYLPVKIRGTVLKGGEVKVDVSQSSQFLSALMMLAPLTDQGMEISVAGSIVSQAYIQLTIALLKRVGIKIQYEDDIYFISGNQDFQIRQTWVEGDYSSASYFAVGAAISRGSVCIDNLQHDSDQGDRFILDIIKKAGANVFWKNKQVHIEAAELSSIDENMNSHPDLVPSLAVMSLFGKNKSRIRAIEHLRFKETDRLKALIDNIGKLQGKITQEKNDLIIEPVPLRGAAIPTFNDHRIAMSFALAGLRIPGIIIENPECVNKSFPKFWHYFEHLTKTTQ